MAFSDTFGPLFNIKILHMNVFFISLFAVLIHGFGSASHSGPNCKPGEPGCRQPYYKLRRFGVKPGQT